MEEPDGLRRFPGFSLDLSRTCGLVLVFLVPVGCDEALEGLGEDDILAEPRPLAFGEAAPAGTVVTEIPVPLPSADPLNGCPFAALAAVPLFPALAFRERLPALLDGVEPAFCEAFDLVGVLVVACGPGAGDAYNALRACSSSAWTASS